MELNLVRSGAYVLAVPEDKILPRYRTEYSASVRRGWDPANPAFYWFPMNKFLPAIKIPLRENDPEAILDLQPLIDQCYRNGGYEDINYERDPEPPFDRVQAAWADKLLRAAGRRQT